MLFIFLKYSNIYDKGNIQIQMFWRTNTKCSFMKKHQLKIKVDVGFLFNVDSMQLEFYSVVVDIGEKRKEVTSFCRTYVWYS